MVQGFKSSKLQVQVYCWATIQNWDRSVSVMFIWAVERTQPLNLPQPISLQTLFGVLVHELWIVVYHCNYPHRKSCFKWGDGCHIYIGFYLWWIDMSFWVKPTCMSRLAQVGSRTYLFSLTWKIHISQTTWSFGPSKGSLERGENPL